VLRFVVATHAGAPAVARWGGLGGASTPKPDHGGGGGGGGGGRSSSWQDRPPREEWRSRQPPRQRTERPEPRDDAPAPVWREAEAPEAGSVGGGWGDDDEGDSDRGSSYGAAYRNRAAPSYGDTGAGASRGERRPGGWSSGGGRGGPGGPGSAGPDGAPARKWQTTRERREADPTAGPTLVAQLQGEAVYGVAPVRAALAAGRRAAAHVLFVQDSMDMSKRKDAAAVAEIIAAASAAGATVRHVEKHDLNLLSDNRPHQGIVLDTAPLELVPLRALPPPSEEAAASEDDASAPPRAAPVWVALDEVSDPQNFGAVLRSALFLGAAGVVVCSRNSAPLSPVVSKASSGAMELLPVHACANMPTFLATSAANGWDVLGADVGPGADDCAQVRVTRPTVLVLGSEGKGLRTNVRRECAKLVCVPSGGGEQRGAAAGVDSLNVGVAAGVLLHALLGAARRGAA
jgi:21S rRNA (GM2251-2'-O)-methyltransferase